MSGLTTLTSLAMWNISRTLCLVTGLWAAGLGAQEAPALPLFAALAPIEITLAVPLRTLINRARRRTEYDGYVEYADANGDPVHLDVEVRTRGNSRLEICRFPPLSVNFKRGQVARTLFEGQNRIKLVTLCRNSDRYEQYLYLEHLAYLIYGQVTPYGYRTRFATVTYIDTDRDNSETVAPAFFIEHIDSIADRVGMRASEIPSAGRDLHAPAELTTLTVFQFLIGNTDWSALGGRDPDECCHNADLLMPAQADAPVIAVPYDFDQSGLVDAEYAKPVEQFRTNTVRTRIYRGFCVHNEHLDAVVDRFGAERDNIERMIEQSELNDEQKAKALDYIREGLDALRNPDDFESQILDRCRGQNR